jgi:hypothetical protein
MNAFAAEDMPIATEATVATGGVPVIQRTFTASSGVMLETLALPLEQDGYSFAVSDIQSLELDGETLTRTAAKTAILYDAIGDEADFLRQFPATLDCTEDGYSGQLYLDASTVIFEAESFEVYTQADTVTREVTGLPLKDPALLEPEFEGRELSFVAFTQDADGLYTATATYEKTVTEFRPASFTATATYTGEITKTLPGDVLYAVTYEGTPIEQALPEPPQPATAGVDLTGAESETATSAVITEATSGTIYEPEPYIPPDSELIEEHLDILPLEPPTLDEVTATGGSLLINGERLLPFYSQNSS